MYYIYNSTQSDWLWAPYFLNYFESDLFYRDGPFIKNVSFVETQKMLYIQIWLTTLLRNAFELNWRTVPLSISIIYGNSIEATCAKIITIFIYWKTMKLWRVSSKFVLSSLTTARISTILLLANIDNIYISYIC